MDVRFQSESPLASAPKDPAVSSLHGIVWSSDPDFHVDVLVLWWKTNFIIAALITQARLQDEFAALVVGGHGDVKAQDGATFVNRQRFVVPGLELAHDRPGVAYGPNRNAARRFDLQRRRNRVLTEWPVSVNVIAARDVDDDSRLQHASPLGSIIRVITVDADVGLRHGRGAKVCRQSNQHAQQRNDKSSMDQFCFHFGFDEVIRVLIALDFTLLPAKSKI
ncbi:MAG: hypothetical protein QOG23_991 [Blastocatellia bacterium]|nr:hypothetical protein [Blastocatellia bacterium]